MKKIYNKISQQQWRVTVPNIHSPFTKKKLDHINGEENPRHSGCYDLEAARKDFDRSTSLPDNIYVNEYNTSSEDDEDDEFHDAKTSTTPKSNDCEFYVDVDYTKKIDQYYSTPKTEKVEYDVPKISFQFFESSKLSKKSTDQETIHKSQVEVFVSNQDIKRNSCEILPIVGIVKCGSDPNIPHYDSDDDDHLYKIPRSLDKSKRLSRSLSDISQELQEILLVENDPGSVEHISCSQVITQKIQLSNENLDYCKTRSRLPLRIRRPTFLRKPKNISGSWNRVKSKLNTAIVEQSEKQRVGAFDENSRIAINLEEMYQSSKAKCKNALKIFMKKKSQDDNESKIMKNDAFFTKLTPNDIEYKLNYSDENNDIGASDNNNSGGVGEGGDEGFQITTAFSSVLRREKSIGENQNSGYEDLRKYVKNGGDFCKELASIFQEMSEAEIVYAKSLSKLSTKLLRACKDGSGGVNDACRAIAIEMQTRSDAHHIRGLAVSEETAKPLRNLSTEQHRIRKQSESHVDKAVKTFHDWRTAEAKAKKSSHNCARDNEKLQDAAIIDTKANKLTLSKNSSLIQLHKTHSEKDTAKLEGKKKKAEDAVKKADIEYYTLCVRAERARLEWESAMSRGVNTFQNLEEERLRNLNAILNTYYQRGLEIGPKIVEAIESLKNPIQSIDINKELDTFLIKKTYQQHSEQLLPDFYCEHITLAMNRERRKQALVKLSHLIRQDIERERKSKNGLENLSKAMKETPNFGTEDSQQTVQEKIYHMKSMLIYLEGARYKVRCALAELDNRPKMDHPLAPHISITRDKSGLQQSTLKVPQWLRDEWLETQKSPVSDKSDISDILDPNSEWFDRGAGDGNSNQPDSDFDEFSSQCSSSGLNNDENSAVQPIAQCKAIYAYTPNLTDELALQPGDLLAVYRQQSDGWWLGECRGNVGIFPATYVEIIKNEIQQA